MIERLTGVNLPRGQEIQTRAPTEIRMKSHPKGEKLKNTVSYFMNEETKRQEFEMENLSELIRVVQKELTNDEKSISFQPIIVTIYNDN